MARNLSAAKENAGQGILGLSSVRGTSPHDDFRGVMDIGWAGSQTVAVDASITIADGVSYPVRTNM